MDTLGGTTVIELSYGVDLDHFTADEIADHRSWFAERAARAAVRNRAAHEAHAHARQLAGRPPRFDDDDREAVPPPVSLLELITTTLTAAPPARPAPIITGRGTA